MLAAAVFLAIAQIQAGWLQHDLGHCAVFKSAFWNQAAHYFLISHLKGASSWWWKSKHNRHHAKTNIVRCHSRCEHSRRAPAHQCLLFTCR